MSKHTGSLADLVDVGVLDSYMMSGLNHTEAISEFADNTFGEAAGDAPTLWVVDCLDGVVFIDRGNGLQSVQDFFVLGRSKSKGHASDIGSFGVGSKKGAFVFGMRIEAHTVHKGRYTTHAVDWSEVYKNPDAVPMHDGTVLSSGKAPDMIKGGGTMIGITKPFTKGSKGWAPRRHHSLQREALTHLTALFYPGLLEGRDIILTDTQNTVAQMFLPGAKVGRVRGNASELLEQYESQRGVGKPVEVPIEVDGKGALVSYHVLPQGAALLSGVHLDYGYRRVEHLRDLPALPMHARMYARVRLSSAWKHDLNDVKTKLVGHRWELLSAVAAVLREAVEKLNDEKARERTVRLSLAVSNTLTELLSDAMRRAADGTHKVTDGDTIGGGGKGGGGGGGKGGDKEPNTRKPTDGTTHKPSTLTIKIKVERGMDQFDTGHVVWESGASNVMIKLNESIVGKEPEAEAMAMAGMFMLSEFLTRDENRTLRHRAFGNLAEVLRAPSNVYAFLKPKKVA